MIRQLKDEQGSSHLTLKKDGTEVPSFFAGEREPVCTLKTGDAGEEKMRPEPSNGWRASVDFVNFKN